jgi:MerR family transcriptional regulator, heat shock protein HspR
MTRQIIPRDLVARELAVSAKVLLRYESLGLVDVVREGSVEGYEPAQIRRIWRIVSFQRDLGINLAGVEVILRLHDHLAEVHRRVDQLAVQLRDLLDAELPNSSAESHD